MNDEMHKNVVNSCENLMEQIVAGILLDSFKIDIYVRIVSDSQKSCKNSTDHSCVPCTEFLLTFTFTF